MYITIETRIRHGIIIPLEPKRLPKTGKGLLTVDTDDKKKPDWNRIKACIGNFKPAADPVKWQRKIRREWDKR